ncbi:hypothetical protein GWK16_04410 [Roseomonas sp. JC162]|uniref:Uncharacterized protein n=1 Tax=Neoroseomonas marina TaxID=1232220 RepID=A0A848E8H9_9PROT|nr:hypothetical protein [Neoroseomonas marina]NMJ40472.1 hypothetical protein [Neoroseomonas marina]
MARLVALLLLFAAQPAAARSWTEEKCELYGQAWAEAVRQRGTAGLSPGFLAAHQAFLASGCRDRGACPRSAGEIAMADLMTVAAVNARISGTFLPFICRP